MKLHGVSVPSVELVHPGNEASRATTNWNARGHKIKDVADQLWQPEVEHYRRLVDLVEMINNGTLSDDMKDFLIQSWNTLDECNETARHLITKEPILWKSIEDAKANIPDFDTIQDVYRHRTPSQEEEPLEYFWCVLKWGQYYIGRIDVPNW